LGITMTNPLPRPEPQALQATIEALAARFGNRLITSQAVRDQHADAALISNEATYRSGSVAVAAPGVFVAEPLRHTVVTANLIKFTN